MDKILRFTEEQKLPCTWNELIPTKADLKMVAGRANLEKMRTRDIGFCAR